LKKETDEGKEEKNEMKWRMRKRGRRRRKHLRTMLFVAIGPCFC
jgi:hypothetical protein